MAVHVGIKLAVQAARNPEGTKKLLITILVAALTIMALPAIILLGVSALLEQGEALADDYDITQTEIYQDIFPVYRSYMDEQTEKMIEQALEIVEENTIIETYTEVEIDPETGEEVEVLKSREICTVDVYVICNHMDFAYLFAYLSLNNENIISAEKYNLREEELLEFLSSIQRLQIEHLGSNYYIYNEFYSMEEIMQLAAGDDETQQDYFIDTFGNYKEFLKDIMEPENYHFGGADEAYKNDIALEDGKMIDGMPEWYQYTGAWASHPYGAGTISSSGCAIVCLAMVTSYMKGEVITPLDIVEFTGDRYYQAGAGSTWNIFPAIASHYGYNSCNLGKNSAALIAALQSGHPVIASMRPGTFTKGGHFIVLKGITKDGKILVNDPNDNDGKNHNHTEFSLNLILTEGKNFWSFY